MDNYTIIITTLLVLVVIILFGRRRRNNLPAGPWGVPLLGYFPFLTRQPYKKLNELRSIYGDVYTVQLGSIPTVILNGWPVIKEAFALDSLTGRPHDVPFKLFSPLTSFGTSDGSVWKEQRRHAFNVLKILGFGQLNRMQLHVTDEIESLIKVINSDFGSKPINVRQLLSPSMSNIITSLVFGQRYEHGSETRKFLDNVLDNSGANPLLFALMIVFPDKKWLFTLLSKYNLVGFGFIGEKSEKMVQFVNGRIEEHKKTIDENVIRDYIDGFLIEMNRKENNGETSTFTHDMLSGNVRGFFSAGSDTVRTTLEWLLLLLSDAKYSYVQERMYQEISKVTQTGPASHRSPVYDDRLKTPYTMAVIHEIQRWKTIVPLNLARRAMADVIVNGVLIPKDTQVLANFWSIHFDEKLFPNPDTFNPNHFLENEENGLKFKKRSEFVAFSLGKRSCPGESLALIELYLYTTFLVQNYMIKSGSDNVDYTESLGITSQPKTPVNVIFEKRV